MRRNIALARELRRTATPCEHILWRELRNGRLGQVWRRQHPLGPFVVDFYCAASRLVVEVDGPVHLDEHARCRDARRTQWLERHGARVIRFTNDDVLESLPRVLAVIRALTPDPSPVERERGGDHSAHARLPSPAWRERGQG